MSLTGRVLSVEDRWITVEVQPLAGCQGCKACAGLLAGGDRQGPRRIRALRQGFSLVPGDEVRIDTRPGEGSLTAFLVFGVPMAGFFGGLLAGPALLTSQGLPSGDWQGVVGGGIGLGLAALVILAGYRWGLFERWSLKVVEKLAGDSLPPASSACPKAPAAAAGTEKTA